MEFEHVLSEARVLSETNIDFYGNPDVQFHFTSGRLFEPETREEEQDDGSVKRKTTINTTPCPHVDVYDNGASLDVLVHLPMRNPIIIDHFVVHGPDEYDAFFAEFVESLEEGYNGIEEVTEFTDESEGSLGLVVANSLRDGTPSEVPVPELAH